MNIAIFASGTGSNAVKIIEYFKDKPQYCFLVLSNKKDAPVLEKAKHLGINTWTFGKEDFYKNGRVLNFLKEQKINFIVLAGFLWLVPEEIVKYFPKKIINLHPSLLPKYGGKGMFGSKVHEAVIQAKEKKSGITIHYVNEKYDEGDVIFQAECDVSEDDTPESLAAKIHALEHHHLPRVLENLLADL